MAARVPRRAALLRATDAAHISAAASSAAAAGSAPSAAGRTGAVTTFVAATGLVCF